MTDMMLRLFLLLAVTISVGAQVVSPIAARQGFKTHLVREERVGEPADEPPAGELDLVHYPAELGRNAAYVSSDPKDGKKHPAIIWLVGGFSNSIGDIAWTPGPKENDQSASGFREKGIVMMYPSLRGGNDNPGYKEAFFGEVDDVLAAADFLAKCDYVDPSRIYLGGHSTGGTLALLVAASARSGQFRAVFSLGPVDDVIGYGADVLPFDISSMREARLREPQRWLASIRCPTYVFEGTGRRSNIDSLRILEKRSTNPLVVFYPMAGGTHFSIIHPLVEEMAMNIVADESTQEAFAYQHSGAK